MSDNYKVLIPSAGLGTRLEQFSKNLNKALISVSNKPVISHVIEKFPKDIEIVIALGHKGDLVKDYINLAHPDRKIVFVKIDNYCGPGSGLGYTIMECQEYLQCPFIFCPNDTLVLEDIPKPSENWMGYAETDDKNSYRSIKINNSNVQKIIEKDEESSSNAYIGLAGIHNYKEFWNHMNNGVDYGSILIGESYGLKHLIKDSNVKARKFTWFDTGNLKQLEDTRNYFKKDNGPEILEKPSEAIWFVNERVVKFSIDEDFIDKRIKRARVLNGNVPQIIDHKKNMYSYKMVRGNTISKMLSSPLFSSFLDFMQNFWTPHEMKSGEKDLFKETCDNFYRKKTYKRIKQYFNRFQHKDAVEIINGIEVPKLYDLLDKVDWEYISEGTACGFHGDLHFENILVSESGNFLLLDWRQDFGGILEYGDLYYDLAKLLHGMIVSHELVNKNMFTIERDANVVKFDILRKNIMVECERKFENFVNNNKYDMRKVRFLTALVFLNIAPLHHYPYSEFLFYLGKYQLHSLLEEGGI